MYLYIYIYIERERDTYMLLINLFVWSAILGAAVHVCPPVRAALQELVL